MTETEVGQFKIERCSFDHLDDATLAAWKTLWRHTSSNDQLLDPAWLRGYFAGQLENLTVYLLYRSGTLCGVAPFLRKYAPLKWHIGEVAVAKPQLRRLRLLGNALNMPEDEAACDTLFAELIQDRSTFDTLQFEGVPVDSFLYRYLHTSPLICRKFRRYLATSPAPHAILRFTHGSFDEYMKKFSRKHRQDLRRDIRRVRDGALGEMRFREYTTLEDVETFLGPAVELSKKTYQWNLHQRGLSSIDLVKQRMLFAAENGWLRSYMLFCGDVPAAFVVAFQYKDRFVPLEVAFDPAMAKYSVGTVLQLLVLEDLFARNTPAIQDFGGYGAWKDFLSTENYQEAEVLLFRPGAYTRFVQEGHRACRILTKAGVSILQRMNLKSRMKRAIRTLSTSKAETSNSSGQIET